MKIRKKSILEGLHAKKITPKSVPYGQFVKEVETVVFEQIGPDYRQNSKVLEQVNCTYEN